MARSGIQYSDVQQAIDTLLTRGDTPSVQRIREVLGTGSFTTISEHFRHWRTEREQNRDIPPPKGVPEVVVSVASEIWREAQDVANQALVHYREEANRQVEEAQQAAIDAAHLAANAEQRESAFADHLRHTEQRLEALNRDFAASQANEQHLLKAANEAREESQQLKKAHEALQQHNTTLTHQHAVELKEQQSAWAKRLAQEEQRNENAEGRLMTMLDEARQERVQEEKALQKRLHQKQQRIETLTEELKLNRNDLLEQQTQVIKYAQQARELEQHITSLEERLASLTQQLTDAQASNKQQVEQANIEREWQVKMAQQMAALQQQLSELPASINVREKQPKGDE
ncbi:MAG: DNA-binding protein [Halomonas sp.]|nr:DNA-binding protein [Halomonas sp.]MBP5981330.1 DNA-binding protein [Halomonas sp.]